MALPLAQGKLPAGALPVLASCSVILIVTAAGVASRFDFHSAVFFFAFVAWGATASIVLYGLRSYPLNRFGPANTVTSVRAVATAVLASLIPVAGELQLHNNSYSMWFVCLFALFILALDGLDGYLARRSKTQTDFGARFDMETDAFLALIIALIVWQSGKLGAWILLLGIVRYVFVLASLKLVSLQGELYPSLRRKAICVVQISALCVLLCPWIHSELALVIGLIALVCLLGSFLRDILWLLRNNQSTGVNNDRLKPV
ncbi:MAG: CDP-alcohol phosphatidyltransferase family protein [Granulosicoccus sp.]